MSVYLHARGHALLLGVALGALCYGLTKAVGLPVLYYLPLEGTWTTSPPSDAVSMSYYGLCLNGLFGFVCGFAVGHLPMAVGRFATRRGANRLIRFTMLSVAIGVALSVGAEMSISMTKPSPGTSTGAKAHEALGVGDILPDFTLQTDGGQWVSRADVIGKGPLVLFFYPKDNTSGCTRQACSFRDEMANFSALGAQVFGVSSDSVRSHDKFVDDHNLNYPLLADPGGVLRRALGVPKTLGILAGRVTYVFDTDGVIRHVYNSQIGVFQHVKEALSAVKRIVNAQ